MRKKDRRTVRKFTKRSANRSLWHKFVQVMACFVVFCTTYALILPAITVEHTYYCGLEAHTHSAECYGPEGEQLICTLDEHSHDESCYPNREADLETAADWESTLSQVSRTGSWANDLIAVASSQIGYQESLLNYDLDASGVKKGYTRYGAWYGIPYGDWDAMYVSFCLHYAGIPQETVPRESSAERWLAALRADPKHSALLDTVPEAGDLLFYSHNGQTRVAIVTDAAPETDPGDPSRQVLYLLVMEGNYDDAVVRRRISTQDTNILASYSIAGAQNRPVAEIQSPQEDLSNLGGGDTASPAAETASVTLKFTSWSQYNAINFPQGNNYTCPVGSTITITLRAGGANYSEAQISVTGGQLVSKSYTCGTPGCNHANWCGTNPVHTIVVKATSTAVTINGSVTGADWNNNSVTISQPGSGGTEPTDPPTDPTDPPTEPTDPPTNPTEPSTEPTEPSPPTVPNYPHYPHAVHTGSVEIGRLRFYNLCEGANGGISALAGCVFEVRGENGYFATVVSGDDPEVHLPDDIPDGNYTITEVSTPAGYVRDMNYERTFQVKDGILTSTRNIGTFINHSVGTVDTGKTAEVEDYNNRIYQILLTAQSFMRTYQMDPVDVLFVVDQSNSMLFPSGLEPVAGKTVTLRLDGWDNVRNMENLNLDKNQMYYIISDPQGTSTVWCIWYNGQSWMYQDASYYAKAKHENAPGYQDPNERAIFPENRSYADQANAEPDGVRSNGGGLGFNLSGSGLGKYVDTLNGDTGTFQIYTATNEFNRLHYLEEALANMVYALADINSENRVTLTRFTKEVDEANCIGPLKLTPQNTETLINAVTHINTGGGTRQDLALKHVYEQHLNDASDGYSGDPRYTYTILITDGAPVLSGGSELTNLGGPNDAPSTTANSVYAQIKGYANLVKQKSTLMTVGLGMQSVDAGRSVLQQIASNNDFYCALDDAADLVESMQRLLFKSFRPKEYIEILGDVVDEISDSFYPIAWVGPGGGAATGRQVLVSDGARDWILLQEGDWVTLEGGYTTAGASDAAGQLLRKEDGTFYVVWNNVLLSNPYGNIASEGVAWVNQGSGSGTGRTVIATYGGKDWIQLRDGDYISQEGEYYRGTPNSWSARYYGRYNASTQTVVWGSSANGNNRQMFESGDYGWDGTVYVKAKEDFIGGNAIDTNKSAYVAVNESAAVFDTPTVNVQLLDMNQMSSEVTVYLGDLVNEPGNAPLDSLKYFFEHTVFTKLISDGGDVLNKVTADSADGLENAVFYLRYAMGSGLTDDQWATLANGGTVTVQYTYDSPSSHGPVGEFTFRLEKTGIPGASPDYGVHEATAACQSGGPPLTENCESPAETYTLHITYRAYRLGEAGRPTKNVHNDANGPGTEVGTGTTVETGLGTLVKENVHEVHVISGEIVITKRFAEGLTDTGDRTFTFILHRLEDGEATSADRTGTITIPAGQSAGTASLTFGNLKRGTYTVTEAVDEAYAVKSITVLNTTNCDSTPGIGGSAKQVTFVMGDNTAGENVIGRNAPEERYTSYIDPVNGVFGAAVFTNDEIVYSGEIPVEKIWDDGPESHSEDTVWLVLYRDDVPVLDSEGRARVLKVDASTDWKGIFTVTLADKEDLVSNYSYSVREVSAVSGEALDGWLPALLENDGETLLYYERAVEQTGQIGINARGYMVTYEPAPDNGWIVTNYRTADLPKTGGIGTHYHTFGGLLLIAAALMYICITGRKRQKGGP